VDEKPNVAESKKSQPIPPKKVEITKEELLKKFRK
jgi:hypothetical protein